MSRTIVVAVFAPLVIAGCSRAVSTVPMRGSEPAVAQLAGTWEGEYSSAETGRSGAITFQLRAGADTAEGEVVMTARGDAGATPSVEGRQSLGQAGRVEALRIQFVLASGNEVYGVLDPYRDPVCGCALTTTFRGVITGDVIEGTFESIGTGFHHSPQQGRWRVVRRR